MAQLTLALISMLELFLTVFYFSADYITSDWIGAFYLLFLLVEPACYYIFSSIIAMRGIMTSMDLVTMLLMMPPYYISLLLMVILRLDMHESLFLSSMIYHDFSLMSWPRQLLAHVYGVSLPLLFLTATHMMLDGFNVVGGLVLVSTGVSIGYFLMTAERVASRRSVNRRNHSVDHNRSISESESDPTYLNSTPLLTFEESRYIRR